MTARSEAWQQMAACIGDMRMTVPSPDTARVVIEERCKTCPVIANCATWARAQREYEGVAGGRWWVNGHPARLPYKRPDDWGTSPEQLRWGHARYARGLRDPDTIAIERAYQAARKRRRRKVAA